MRPRQSRNRQAMPESILDGMAASLLSFLRSSNPRLALLSFSTGRFLRRPGVPGPREPRRQVDVSPRPCPACGSGMSSDAGAMNGWSMAQCATCGLVYTCDVPTAGQIQAVYDRAYQPGEMYDMHLKELDEVIRTGRSRQGFYRTHCFLGRYRPRPGDKLLEVGCGIGTFLVAASQRGW